MNAAEFLALVEGKTGHKAKQVRKGWSAHCPAHDDKESSLSVMDGNGGKVVMRCFAGCSFESIIASVNVPARDLCGERRQGGGGGALPPKTNRNTATPKAQVRAQAAGCTLAQYSEAKRLPVEFLKSIGVSEITYQGNPALRIQYLDATGVEAAIRFRLALTKGDGTDDRFRWKSGSKPFIYGVWRRQAAVEAGHGVLVEGESDCHTLWLHGIPAFGVPGAASWRDERDAAVFDGVGTIYVVIEPDKGGDTLRTALSKSRLRDRVRFVTLDGFKDASDLHVADPDRFRERWTAALAKAIPYEQQAHASRDSDRKASFVVCQRLATLPDILSAFQCEIEALGLVGEPRLSKIIFLALVSRVFDRPVSIAVKGPSSGGKSFNVETVLRFFPPSAFYALTAMSDHALAYSDEPLKHRVLVLYEVTGMESDIASYLIRSLLSEGCVRYEVVEKTPEGLRARMIEREGPTGLLVTTTATRLHPENETRLLSLHVTDTQEQTRLVLASLARRDKSSVSVEPWHALQLFIENGPCAVHIPFAEALANCIPPVAVRLRRDFRQILTLIEAHALLHQASRQRDEQGRIVAQLADYAAIRELVADIVSAGVEATVPASVRETVQVVADMQATDEDSGVSIAAIAHRLRLDKSAASRRVSGARDRGYLVNMETRKGKPARWRTDEPLPDDVEILPPPESIGHRCSVAVQTEGIDTPHPPHAQGQPDELDIPADEMMEVDASDYPRILAATP